MAIDRFAEVIGEDRPAGRLEQADELVVGAVAILAAQTSHWDRCVSTTAARTGSSRPWAKAIRSSLDGCGGGGGGVHVQTESVRLRSFSCKLLVRA